MSERAISLSSAEFDRLHKLWGAVDGFIQVAKNSDAYEPVYAALFPTGKMFSDLMCILGDRVNWNGEKWVPRESEEGGSKGETQSK